MKMKLKDNIDLKDDDVKFVLSAKEQGYSDERIVGMMLAHGVSDEKIKFSLSHANKDFDFKTNSDFDSESTSDLDKMSLEPEFSFLKVFQKKKTSSDDSLSNSTKSDSDKSKFDYQLKDYLQNKSGKELSKESFSKDFSSKDKLSKEFKSTDLISDASQKIAMGFAGSSSGKLDFNKYYKDDFDAKDMDSMKLKLDSIKCKIKDLKMDKAFERKENKMAQFSASFKAKDI